MSIIKGNTVFIVIVYIVISNLNFKAFGQNDTIWYDKTWKTSIKDDAAFYRPPVSKKGELYLIRDYYIDGSLQMEGTSSNPTNDFWEGVVTWYDTNGKVIQSFTYENNRLEGDFITYYKDKKLTAQYKDGRFVSGEANFNNGTSQTYLVQRDSILKEVVYDKDLNGARYEYFKKNTGTYLEIHETKFYDNDGKYIGTSTREKETGIYKGVYVTYYRSPLRVKQVRDYKYKNGRVVATYYQNGVLRNRFVELPKQKIEYFDLEGNLLHSVALEDPNKSWSFINGTHVQFYSNTIPEEMHLIEYIEEFNEEGDVVYMERFYKNKKTKSKILFENKYKKEEINYDKEGNQASKLTYKDYKPYQGTLVETGRAVIYNQGTLMKETTFYPDTNIPFSVFQNSKATFYDQKGLELGQVTSNSDEYLSEEDGTRYRINYKGKINYISKYSKGNKISEKTYRYFPEDTNKVGIVEQFYEGYKTLKQVTFYHDTPKKRSVLFYKKGSKAKEIFYDRSDNEIATYDHQLKQGILYKYFSNTDVVEEYKEMDNGTLVKSKKYKKRYMSNTSKEYEYVLIEDIDINTKAVFYKESGEVIAELLFKDKKPYEGVAYNHTNNSYLTFKNAKKNGVYKRMNYSNKLIEEGYYINDKREGAFVNYDYNGNKQTVKNYTNDMLEGETIYYDTQGNLISKLIYKKDLPYQGKEVHRGEEVWYENGAIVKKEKTSKNQVVVTDYISENNQDVVVYNANRESKKYSYSLKDYKLEGNVIRYDTNGSILHTAIFDNGVMKSGEILIKENSYNLRVYSKIFIKLNQDTLSIKCFDKESNIMLEVTEKANDYNEFPNAVKLGLNMNYLGPTILF
ncbi:Antitoxin component YwqK of the YwqJK toxin-antitoxin module [Aquimarina amphilecti]|uniref:Antitoxin component YwqK of the YwqJK toxin-antitoxin module n=1 Tax=Aquimarina amphilecti TaxID=1038014 RepID=A0A1H7GLM8_AQUAM|nr:hypothetical protein [Aquimarina amphilecti]SEK38447.1 Antitoxin component YwqK of the YwqJK toxin-antitoxin module [Aquimarina amphilecti]